MRECITAYYTREIRSYYASGLNARQISIKIPELTIGQISGYIAYYNVPNKEEIERMEKEKAIIKEMPPTYKSECFCRVDKEEAERLAKEANAKDVICKLEDGKKAFSLNGVVIGSCFYQSRAVVN